MLVEDPRNIPDCASAFVKLLGSMARLESLTFNPNANLHELLDLAFAAAFTGASLKLPSVKSLSMYNSQTYLRYACPSTTRLTVWTSAVKNIDSTGWGFGAHVTSLSLVQFHHKVAGTADLEGELQAYCCALHHADIVRLQS